MVEPPYNTVFYNTITYSVILINAGYKAAYELPKNPPYLALTGELCMEDFCEYFGEKVSCYKEVQLYDLVVFSFYVD